MGIKVLSLFDGISCGQIALERAGIKVAQYYASEINSEAILVTNTNFTTTIQIGDVTKIYYKDGVLCTENGNFNVGEIDLLIGGSPCQDFSTLNSKRLGLSGDKSGLFYEYARILKEVKPKYFLLENNNTMPKIAKQEISLILGVEPVMINSSLVSAQNRKRLYWTNIGVNNNLIDKHIEFKNIISDKCIEEIKPVEFVKKKIELLKTKFGYLPQMFCPYNLSEIIEKHPCLTAQGHSQTKSSSVILKDKNKLYILKSEIWEELQNIPQGYTSCLKKEGKRKVVIGNAWTVDVIAHIFKGLENT